MNSKVERDAGHGRNTTGMGQMTDFVRTCSLPLLVTTMRGYYAGTVPEVFYYPTNPIRL
jgi:hypothetical protein